MKMIKMFACVLAVGLLASPALAATKTYKNVSIIDVDCSTSDAAKNADTHTRECALKCQDSGFGIVTADNKFIKFDADGNAQLLKQLKASSKTDHLRVNVTGDEQGDTLKVEKVKLL
jgi:hypothetical protein